MTESAIVNQMLDTVNKTAEMETEYRVCPPVEANASVIEWEFKSGTRKSKDGETEEPWYALNLTWDVDSQEAREEIGRDQVKIDGNPIFLRFMEDGSLSPSDNQQFARLAALCKVETEGRSLREIFNSFVGCRAFVKVTHRPYQAQNGESRIAANVSSYAEAQ